MQIKNYSLPYDLLSNHVKDHADNVFLLNYNSTEASQKTRISLHYNLFSFLIKGEKSVHYSDQHIKIDASQFLLLSSGNCLMSEKMAAENNGGYKSILLFFDNKILSDFFIKHPLTLASIQPALPEVPFVVFQKDEFLFNFIASLEIMITKEQAVNRELQRIKLEELLLYLSDKYPSHILGLRNAQEINEDIELRKAVEASIDTNMTMEELAFLCNTSLSTFKRRFAKIYGTSPNKWLLQKRMQKAANLLKQGNLTASEIYYKVGYENLSSFIQSFKHIYGVTPKKYQSHH